MAAQIARIAFKVPKTIAAVYDLQRERSFHAAGIDTASLTVAGAQLLASKIEALSPSPREAPLETPGPPAPAKPLSMPVPPRSTAGAGPYYVIIVGGGKIGYYLGRTLLAEGMKPPLLRPPPRPSRSFQTNWIAP